MNEIYLRKIKSSDRKYFAKWWRDKELLKLTSGILKRISDQEVDKYFEKIFHTQMDYHFMVMVNGETIGHVSLTKRQNSWYETQIVIGEKEYWNKGYGAKAIKSLIEKAKHFGISKIYLEVRPTNTRAIKAYENCGFQKAETKKYLRNKRLPQTLKMKLYG